MVIHVANLNNSDWSDNMQVIIDKEAAEILKKQLSEKNKAHSLKIVSSVVG